MPQIDMPFTVQLDHTLRVTPLSTLFSKGDNAAHRFILTIMRGGVQEDLTGCEVKCKFYRMAESTVVDMDGAVEDRKAVAVLEKACYAYIGRFTVTISIKKGEQETTVFCGDGYMRGQSADNAISGEYIIYDIDTLLEKLSEIDAATSAANTAAGNANTAAGAANTAAGAANTAAGTASTAAGAANTAAGTASAAAKNADAAAARLDGMTAVATGLAAGSVPTVNVTTGEDGARVLAFGIPKGDKGETGATPQMTVRVSTGEPGTEASAVQGGTPENPTLELTIPRGDTGDIGGLTINGKSPDASGAVTLEAGDVGARPDSWTPTAAEVGAYPASGVRALTISIASAAWSGSGPYTATITDSSITAKTDCRFELGATLDVLAADISWETSEGTVTLTTDSVPTGTLAGTLILMDVA